MKAADDILLKIRLLRSNIDESKNDFRSFALKSEQRFDKLYELMDGLAGEFKKFDEEQTILSGHQSDNSDRLEKLEKEVFHPTSP